ncbi:hypothetical protein AMK59_3073, partial [Oryctes borbonicus]
MNEEAKQSIPQKSKKIGADGLSKKERRALKVAQKGDTPINHIENARNLPTGVSNNDTKQTIVKSEGGHQKQLQKGEVKQTIADTKKVLDSMQGYKNKCDRLQNKGTPDKDVTAAPTPSKAQLRAERRAVQEKQRLAKVIEKTEKIETDIKESPKTPIKLPAKKIEPKTDAQNEHRVYLFNHLYFNNPYIGDSQEQITDLHSSFIRLGVQYSSKTILGSNARCFALLLTLREFITDFSSPSNQEFCRSVEFYLQKNTSYLHKCRPIAVSMTNALKHFKLCLTQIDTNLSDFDKKNRLLDIIDTYKQEQIAKAGEAISIKVNEKITNKDVILTYGCSSLIRQLLLDAHREGKHFKVIIVDSRPLLEGREMLRTLVREGIDCTYGLINSVSFIMSKATKVLLGAHALLANGYVMSRVGTAQIALIAQNFNKPVLVCCETYKFCERVQTDCFVYNEIGDSDKLVNIDTTEKDSPLANWRQSKYLQPLNLLYDVTPPDFVTAVVTELGFLPCTSVPVVLRIKP